MILGLKWFFIVAVNYQENILFLIFFLGGANSPDLNLRIVDSQKICLKESLLTHPFFSGFLWDISLWFDRHSGDVASNTLWGPALQLLGGLWYVAVFLHLL